MIKGLDNNYHSVALSTARYDVVGVYPGSNGPDLTRLPTYVSITVKHEDNRTSISTRMIMIKGELAHQFTRELHELQVTLRGNEGDGFQGWRWHDSVIYPFMKSWVAKMDAIKLALKVMDVTRLSNPQTVEEWNEAFDTLEQMQRR